MNTSGSVKFIAEVWQNGRSTRKTLGAYPAMSISDARKEAISFISEVRQGKLKPKKKQLTFIELFEVYLAWLWLLVFG